MATRGTKPQPTERKRRLGNPGKRPLPEKGALRAVPPVGAEVVELTVEQALVRSLHAGETWLSEAESATVALAHDALEYYAELRSNPQARAADVIAAGKWVQSLFSDLAFTPGERARLGLAEVTARSKLDEIAQRRRAAGD